MEDGRWKSPQTQVSRVPVFALSKFHFSFSCYMFTHNQMCSNCWKLQKRRPKKTKINKKEEEKNPWCCRRKISYWPCSFHSVCDIKQRDLWTHIYTTWDNKYLSIPPRLLALLELLRWSVFLPLRQHSVMLNLDKRKLSSIQKKSGQKKKKFASPLLSRHCCINFLFSDDLILHRHDAPLLMMHLFLCVCRQLFAKIQTASNLSCFVSHIQIKKLWRIWLKEFLFSSCN